MSILLAPYPSYYISALPITGKITFTSTAITTLNNEVHTSDGMFVNAGDMIIHDGFTQASIAKHDMANQANYGTFTVADDNITVDVEMWGAAGGSGQGSYTGYGGGGEYRKARMELKPGTYYWMVGGGGGVGRDIDDRQGSGGWGGGGSSGSYSGVGNDATPFGNGGDISTIDNTRLALGAGGGGLTGIFGATSASQADALLIAGGGGGYGYNGGAGLPGGDTDARSGSDTAGGFGGDNGGAGFGGHGFQRGGGGGGGYWGGSGANEGGSAGGGGGRGYTATSSSHSLLGTVSATTTEAGLGQTPGGTSSSNYVTNLASSPSTTARAGFGGRLVITIV